MNYQVTGRIKSDQNDKLKHTLVMPLVCKSLSSDHGTDYGTGTVWILCCALLSLYKVDFKNSKRLIPLELLLGCHLGALMINSY